MCGILGSINLSISGKHLDTIKHRGPDDDGLTVIDLGSHQVSLAQRRLAILDLSAAGHQPMASAGNRATLIFNGEVYNHQSLRDKLPPHYSFRGHSDTETLLYYIQEFGIEAIRDFNGIFSLAFLDHTAEQLYLVRDPFGVKPLYYWVDSNISFIFSSEMRAIRSIKKNESWDADALATLLRLRYNPAPQTIYSRLKKIRPGHYLQIDLSKASLSFSTHHYARRNLKKTIACKSSEYATKYGQALSKAVERQLLSDVEIGVFLSGGIDSAVVAALAQQNIQRPLKAFTVGFGGDHAEDEIEMAAETAELLGLEHHHTSVAFSDFLNQIRNCTEIVEEPLATTSLIPMYYLAKLASQHVKVVLTGQGADEPLGGYNRYKGELVHRLIPSAFHLPIHKLIGWSGLTQKPILRGADMLLQHNTCERFLAAYQVFTPSQIQALIGVKENAAIRSIEYQMNKLRTDRSVHPVEKMMAIDTQLNLADDLLNYTDKITMHFSMECRVPMLDLDFVRYVESLPRTQKLNLRHGKIIHKRFAQSILPPKIVNRKKRAFQSPTAYWFRQESEQISDILLHQGSYFLKVFDARTIASILKEHQAGSNMDKEIFLLLSIYYWMESIAQAKDTRAA